MRGETMDVVVQWAEEARSDNAR